MRRHHTLPTALAAITLAASLVAGLVPGSEPREADAAGRRTVRSKRITRGVRLYRIRDRRGPQRIFVLKVDLRLAPSVDVALSNEDLGGFERTSSMGRRYGGIAAVNGDFGLPSGRPMNDFARNGALEQTRRDSWGYHFGVGRGEALHVGRRRPDITITGEIPGSQPATDPVRKTLDVYRWNDGAPEEGEIAGYSAVGRAVASSPNEGVCSAKLRILETRWRDAYAGVETSYRVEERFCPPPDPLPGEDPAPEPPIFEADAQHVVISARADDDKGAFVGGLIPGSQATVAWSMWTGAIDAVGGIPMLLKNGEIRATRCSQSLCRRHPRTGVGITRTGKLLLVVVDGRRKRAKGMTLLGFAREMKRLGAIHAINLDGGGSSTMWVRGMGIVNKPSDGRERYVSSALVIRPAASGAEPQSPSSTSSTASSTSARSSMSDPASTGGLLDALVAGALGAPVDLPPELDRVVERFRATAREGA